MNSIRDNNEAFSKFHPVFIVAGCLILQGFLAEFWPMRFPPAALDVIRNIGSTIMAIGSFVLILAYMPLIRKSTSIINPQKHTILIVSTGVFAYSRNPIYLGWVILFLGISIVELSWLAFLAPVIMLGLLYWLIVLEEEKYLEKRFGEEYLNYKARVRRWL